MKSLINSKLPVDRENFLFSQQFNPTIMKNITTIALLLLTSLSFAQMQPFGHLTIFSEDGDKFTLMLNGEQINDVPQANLRVEDLVQPYYNAKIVFEDQTKQEISKNSLMIADVDGIFMDVTYKIKRDKNNAKKMKMNFFSMTPIVQGYIPPSNVKVIHYGQPQPVGTVTQTTTTTTNAGGINAGVNVNGVGVSIHVNDGSLGTVSHTQTVSTTTTSGQTVIYDDAPEGCMGARCMTQGNFNSALQSIKNQGFDDTRLKTAKQIASSNCLNASQIADICRVFGFDESKLDFAKFAYNSCTEQNNYFKVNDVFSFSSSVDELTDYIAGK